MRKLILCVLALLACYGRGAAQTVTVADVEALPGETVTFVMNLNGGKADTYASLQFNVQFPSTGFTTTGDYTISSAWKGASATVGDVDETGLAIVPVSSAETIAGSNVESLLTVDFKVGDDVPLGDYDVTLSKITFGYGFTDKDIAPDVTFQVHVVDRITLDENSTTAPMARTEVNVRVNRTINAGEWSTICLPFTMNKAAAESVFGTDVKIKTFSGYTAEIDEETLIPSAITLNFTDYTMNALRPLKAGTPYLIQTSKNIESFELDGVTIVGVTSDVTGNETNYDLAGKFCGTLSKTKVPDKGLFISGNKFYYSTGNTTIKAFRGWFNLQAVLDEAVSVDAPVYFSFDDDTNNINKVKSETLTDDTYYNMAGQRMENPGKGLYIKGNKKVIVK